MCTCVFCSTLKSFCMCVFSFICIVISNDKSTPGIIKSLMSPAAEPWAERREGGRRLRRPSRAPRAPRQVQPSIRHQLRGRRTRPQRAPRTFRNPWSSWQRGRACECLYRTPQNCHIQNSTPTEHPKTAVCVCVCMCTMCVVTLLHTVPPRAVPPSVCHHQTHR